MEMNTDTSHAKVHTGNNDEALPLVLSLANISDVLGVDEQTVKRAIRRGEIPVRRIGRKIRIHRDTFLQWLRGDN